MIKKLLRKSVQSLQKHILGYETEVLTFSQAGEDLIVRNFFYDRLSRGEKGFFVDIGAFHPYRHSNTYYLYRGGWRGMNIDARPGSMDLFKKLRPGDINLEIAVGSEEGTSTYYDFGEDAGLNTISTDQIEKLGLRSRIKAQYSVRTLPLSTIFERHMPKDQKIDFLSIDIEGIEELVLPTNDWTKYRPSLIACEIYGYSLKEISEDVVSNILTSNGFEIYARVNLAMPNVNTVFFIDTKQ